MSPCVRFPSGLSPSVQESHLVSRSLAAIGSRTSERAQKRPISHRRLGITPTPEHASCSQLVGAECAIPTRRTAPWRSPHGIRKPGRLGGTEVSGLVERSIKNRDSVVDRSLDQRADPPARPGRSCGEAFDGTAERRHDRRHAPTPRHQQPHRRARARAGPADRRGRPGGSVEQTDRRPRRVEHRHPGPPLRVPDPPDPDTEPQHRPRPAGRDHPRDPHDRRRGDAPHLRRGATAHPSLARSRRTGAQL